MIQRGQDGIQRRTLEPCPYQDCQQGVVKGMLGSLAECHQCNGLGFVDEESGEALPEREIIRQLVIRLVDIREKARAQIQELRRSNQYLRDRLESLERGR